jgi:hypothetical protein
MEDVDQTKVVRISVLQYQLELKVSNLEHVAVFVVRACHSWAITTEFWRALCLGYT